MGEKIFVSIAAFEDKALLKTIKNILENADNPDDIIFGLALNYKVYPDLSEFNDTVKVIYDKQFDFPGIVKMRNEIRKLITDEVYFLGLDAHTVCKKSWDTKLIKDINELTIDDKKVIISSQINMDWSDLTPRTKWNMGGSWSNGWGLDGHPEENPDTLFENITMINDKYFLNYYISCNFIFMKTQHILNANFPGYHGFPWEEVEQSITCYCNGFDIVAPLIENSYIRKDVDERYEPPFDPDFWIELPKDRWNPWPHHRRKWILDSVDMQIQVEKLLISGKNDYYSLEGSQRTLSDFYKAIGFYDKYLEILCEADTNNFECNSDRTQRVYAPYDVDKLRNDVV